MDVLTKVVIFVCDVDCILNRLRGSIFRILFRFFVVTFLYVSSSKIHFPTFVFPRFGSFVLKK